MIARVRLREGVLLALAFCAIAVPAAAQQTFTGRLSDSACAAAHRKPDHTDRECLFACLNALAKYVLVDADGRVTPIANQDAMGLPLYAGRPVKITGELKGDALVVAKVEAIPAHLHIGHVMTNWRDTPGSRGFLPVAIDEARVAALHAKLAAKSATLGDIKLHAAHVLNALDPAVEPSGPGAGYGVKKAAWMISPSFVAPFLMIPIGAELGILTGNYVLLHALGACMTLYGLYVCYLMLRRPEELAVEENHASWAHMYRMMFVAQLGFALAYLA